MCMSSKGWWKMGQEQYIKAQSGYGIAHETLIHEYANLVAQYGPDPTVPTPTVPTPVLSESDRALITVVLEKLLVYAHNALEALDGHPLGGMIVNDGGAGHGAAHMLGALFLKDGGSINLPRAGGGLSNFEEVFQNSAVIHEQVEVDPLDLSEIEDETERARAARLHAAASVVLPAGSIDRVRAVLRALLSGQPIPPMAEGGEAKSIN